MSESGESPSAGTATAAPRSTPGARSARRLLAPGQSWSQTCKPYPHKRVVLVQANVQYTELFRNWLFHASKYLNPKTEQLVVAAESQAAVVAMKNLSGLFGVHWDVQFIGSASEDSKQGSRYGKGVWSRVVTHRPLQINHLLNQGCSVLYQDVDTVWTRPVFPVIEASGKHDLYLSSDGRPNYLCTCIMYYHPTAGNIRLNAKWAGGLKGKSVNQFVFNMVLSGMKKSRAIEYVILPERFFPWGRVAEKHKHTAAVIHANYLKGDVAKVNFLKHFGYWKPGGR